MSPSQGNPSNNTYIVVFNDNQNLVSAMDDQVATFVSDNNGQILYRYNTINGMAINMPGDAAAKLGSLKNVKYVEKDITFHATLDKAVPIIGAPQVWDLGYTGKGVKVALVDSGIDGTHPDLKGRIVEWKDFVANKNTPYDDFGHGTHCAGIIGGNGAGSGGKYKGVAPEVSYIGIKVLGKDGSGSLSTILDGINYAANSDAQVISMSLGSSDHSQAMDDAVCSAVAKGKIVICAAGNSGPDSKTIGCPSDCKDAISVGATDKNDQIASFSSRGPTSDGRLKPEICAPGKDIVSTRATGIHNEKAVDNYYISMSGTSMACPMVSGSVALMLQKDPTLTAAKVKDILEKTAKRLGSKTPNEDYGYGRINVKSALDSLAGGKTPVTTPTPTPTPKPVISPTPTPTPSPSPDYPYPEYPSYPYPGYPSYPYPYPGSQDPGYPYPGYPYPGCPYAAGSN